MYLATITRAGTCRYEIRQSFRRGPEGGFDHRTVFDLGPDPTCYLERLSEDICYFAEELEDTVGNMTEKDPTGVLEELLWDFLPAEERYRLGLFRGRGRVRLSRLSEQERGAIDREVHLFDRRRLYYLRYGAVDQSRINRLNPRLYRPLLNQSRDEREYYFRRLEKELKAQEMKTYVFAIFDLQRFFKESFAATMPEALDQNDIGDYFVEELCRLNGDPHFWPGTGNRTALHDHLVRYLVMFFDYGYGRRSLFDDFLREFMGRHRAFQWPEKRPEVSTDEITSIFGTDWQSLQRLSRRELTRLYRSKAKQLHPDSGGEHERFVTLNAAYGALLLKKK